MEETNLSEATQGIQKWSQTRMGHRTWRDCSEPPRRGEIPPTSLKDWVVWCTDCSLVEDLWMVNFTGIGYGYSWSKKSLSWLCKQKSKRKVDRWMPIGRGERDAISVKLPALRLNKPNAVEIHVTSKLWVRFSMSLVFHFSFLLT